MTVQLLLGDCRDLLKGLADESVDSIISSPPYNGLRSYLPAGHPNKHLEIGLEPTIAGWVDNMRDVFRECRRVLKPTGTMWLNFGDSYAGDRDPKGRHSDTITGTGANKSVEARAEMIASRRRDDHAIPRSDYKSELPPKNLVGQAWRAAFALQDDGWILRQDIIWSKRAPMPESVRDRFTKSHEYVFLFAKSNRARVWRARDTREWQWTRPTKQQRAEMVPGVKPGSMVPRWIGFDYYFDQDAVCEPTSPDSHARSKRARSSTHKHAGISLVPGAPEQTIAQVPPSAGGLRIPTGWATDTPGRAHDELQGRYHHQRPRNASNREDQRKAVSDRALASATERMGRGVGA